MENSILDFSATGASLRRGGGGWEFSSEAALENFVWNNLESLFGFEPLDRQLRFDTKERCDIVAAAPNRRLAVIELKNVEDSDVVQQLTRYYANLREERGFGDRIDWTAPPRLIAVAPAFHRFSRIDREFHKLDIEFIVFRVVFEQDKFFLVLTNENTGEVRKAEIPFRALGPESRPDIAPPPPILLDWLGACTPEEQSGFLTVRATLLSDPRMKEEAEKKRFFYGSGKQKPCAEILFEKRTQRPVLFLWLPTPNTHLWSRKEQIGRHRIWQEGGRRVTHLGHVPEGFGRMRLESEWKLVPVEKRPRKTLQHSRSHKSDVPFRVDLYFGCKAFTANPILGCVKRRNDYHTTTTLPFHKAASADPDFWVPLANLAFNRWQQRF